MSSRKPPSQRDFGSGAVRIGQSLTSMVPGTMHGRFANASLTLNPGQLVQASDQSAPGDSEDTGDSLQLVRSTTTYTTDSLLAGAAEKGTISMASDYRVLFIETDVSARVRLYATKTAQDSDYGRPITYDPGFGIGIVMDYLTSSPDLLKAPLAPVAEGATFDLDDDGNLVTDVPITVTSVDGGTVTVTLTYTSLESP